MRTRLNGSKMSPFLSLRGRAEAISNNEIPRSNRPRNDILGVFSNEKGIALVMVLILSAIILAIMSGLVYMVISGTQISGIQKRYKTALEAGIGGANVTFQLLQARGDPGIPLTNFHAFEDGFAGISACLNDKLNKSTADWNVACNSSLTITPGTATTYDMTFQLGSAPFQYTVYSKIVDTVKGNSGPDEYLIDPSFPPKGELTPVLPYLYTIEIDAQNFSNPEERAKLSVLYQY